MALKHEPSAPVLPNLYQFTGFPSNFADARAGPVECAADADTKRSVLRPLQGVAGCNSANRPQAAITRKDIQQAPHVTLPERGRGEQLEVPGSGSDRRNRFCRRQDAWH